MRAVRLVLAVLPVLGLSLLAQGTAGPPATYMSAADIAKGLSTAIATDAAAGAAVTISPGIAVRRRNGAGDPQYAIIHPFSTEIYYIVEGTGSLVTGGTLEMPLAPSADPDVVRSKAIKDGVTRRVAKGDVIVVPPGTAHWFNAIDGTITYLESRVRVK
jgi:mannose-6-phosphate isomerase-like protein (cupin superfamily)